MPRAADIVPTQIVPRGMNRMVAAAYIGIGTTLFDRLVSDGRMPRPRKLDGRLVWDKLELDQSFSDLPHDVQDSINPWDEEDGEAA